MVRKRAIAAGHSATLNGARSDRKVSLLVGTALTEALQESGVSVRTAAKLMRVSRSTVERYRRDGHVIPELRSRRVALPFVRNLLRLLEVRNGRAA